MQRSGSTRGASEVSASSAVGGRRRARSELQLASRPVEAVFGGSWGGQWRPAVAWWPWDCGDTNRGQGRGLRCPLAAEDEVMLRAGAGGGLGRVTTPLSTFEPSGAGAACDRFSRAALMGGGRGTGWLGDCEGGGGSGGGPAAVVCGCAGAGVLAATRAKSTRCTQTERPRVSERTRARRERQSRQRRPVTPLAGSYWRRAEDTQPAGGGGQGASGRWAEDGVSLARQPVWVGQAVMGARCARGVLAGAGGCWRWALVLLVCRAKHAHKLLLLAGCSRPERDEIDRRSGSTLEPSTKQKVGPSSVTEQF